VSSAGIAAGTGGAENQPAIEQMDCFDRKTTVAARCRARGHRCFDAFDHYDRDCFKRRVAWLAERHHTARRVCALSVRVLVTLPCQLGGRTHDPIANVSWTTF
jgi:hypothetical protein